MQVISDVMHCCTGQSEESFLPRSGSTFSPGVQRHGEGNAARTYFFNGKASYVVRSQSHAFLWETGREGAAGVELFMSH